MGFYVMYDPSWDAGQDKSKMYLELDRTRRTVWDLCKA